MVAKSIRTTLKPRGTMVCLVIYKGIESFQGFLGAGFRPCTGFGIFFCLWPRFQRTHVWHVVVVQLSKGGSTYPLFIPLGFCGFQPTFLGVYTLLGRGSAGLSGVHLSKGFGTPGHSFSSWNVEIQTGAMGKGVAQPSL